MNTRPHRISGGGVWFVSAPSTMRATQKQIAVLNNGICFAAPEWYRPAYTPIEQITEDEYRYIDASGDWAQTQPPSRNDATMYNDWD